MSNGRTRLRAGGTARVDVVAEQTATDRADPRESVSVKVLDSGPGISEAEADQLFSLYYRSQTANAVPGAGIGLFVCRGLVNAMGGRVWAKPRPEGGAEFGFSLPVYVEAMIPAPKPARIVTAPTSAFSST